MRLLIKNYLNVSIAEKLTPIAIAYRGRNSAIAQKLLEKIDLRLSYVDRLGSRDNQECVYQFVASDDERDVIFSQWLNRDETLNCKLLSLTKNIDITAPVTDTISPNIPQTLNEATLS